MRADMAKVIVERPRADRPRGPGSAYPRGARKNMTRDAESAPFRESMGRGYATKQLNENLQPLQRYLASQVGRPWRLVHAEIAERLSVRSAVQKHVLDHLREIVAEHVWFDDDDRILCVDRIFGVRELESFSGWRRYYVCPRTGLFRIAPLRRRSAPTGAHPLRSLLDAGRELMRLGESWFEVRLAPIPATPEERAACFDCVSRRRLGRVDRGELSTPERWKEGFFAVSKRQLSTKELIAHGLRPKNR